MNSLSQIKNFCILSTRENFFKLNKESQNFFYELSQISINLKRFDKNFENQIKAKRILTKVNNFHITRNLDKNQLKGLKAVVLAAKTYRTILNLAFDEWEKLDLPIPESQMNLEGRTESPLAPVMYVSFSKGSLEFQPGGKGLENHILVIQDLKNTLSSEFLFFDNQLKEYLIEFISDNSLQIEKIWVKFPNGKIIDFFIKNLGVVWKLEDCIKCLQKMSDYDLIDKTWKVKPRKAWRKVLLAHHPDKPGGSQERTSLINVCRKKLLEEKCLDNIRHRADTQPFYNLTKKKKLINSLLKKAQTTFSKTPTKKDIMKIIKKEWKTLTAQERVDWLELAKD